MTFRELNSTTGDDAVCPVQSQLARRVRPEMTLIGNAPGFRQGTIKVWLWESIEGLCLADDSDHLIEFCTGVSPGDVV